MAEVMMQLGSYVFAVDAASYQRLQRATSWRWQAIERIKAAPAMQYMGAGRDEITLDGVMYPAQGLGDLSQMDAMRAEAAKGTPLNLIAAPDDTGGSVHGKWCITRIEQEDTLFLRGGQPQKIKFRVQLVAYG